MRIKAKSYGQYRYSSRGKKPLLYASVYAVLTRHLYQDLDSISEQERKEWTSYIQSHQDEDGLFKDSLLHCKLAQTSDSWGWRHLT